MGPKIKRERLSKGEEGLDKSAPVTIKSEPISDKEDDEELPMPDPDAPKSYKRIRVPRDDDEKSGSSTSSSDEDNTLSKKTGQEKKKKSDLQSEDELSEEYVPLCNFDAVTSSGDDDDNDESDNGQTQRFQNSTKSSHKKTLQRNSKTSNQKKAGANKKKIGVRTRRQKANDTTEESSSSEEDSSDNISEYETGSLNGFIIKESEPDTSIKPLKLDTQKLKTNQQSPAKKRRRRPSKSSESESSDDNSNDSMNKAKYKSFKQKSPSPKRMLRDQDKKRKRLREESSSEYSSDDSRRNGELSNEVVSQLKGFLPTTAGVSSKPKRSRKNNLVLDSRASPELVGGSDSSFIDDDETEKRAGILESSSSSDDDVVPEDPSNLDLNTDNFETLPTSDESYDDSSDSEKSRSSATDEERDAYKNIEEEPAKLEDCCTMCWNLDDIDFRGRENHPYADRWCRCTRCKITSPRAQLGYDRICCREINAILKFIDRTAPEANKISFCITRHEDFEKDVLNYGAVLKAFKGRKSKAEKEFNKSTDKEKVNKVKDCFLRWIFGKDPGKMVIPSCVIREIIRRHAPSAGPLYFSPFNCTKFCRVAKHCVKARL